jgi:RHS repeat-associated protein
VSGRAFCALLLFGALAAVPAAAQQQNQGRLINTPADSFAMAPGGVDMRTGRYVYNETDLSIGGESGLALIRTMTQNIPGHGNPFGNLSHNWDITVSEIRINYDNPQQWGPGYSDYRIFVNFGGRSQTFKARATSPGFGYESSAPMATLTNSGGPSDRASASVVYTFQASDGSVAVFRPLGVLGTGGCSHERRCANIAQLTQPDGTVLTFDYVSSGGPAGGTERLRSVTSSRGYALVFEGTENRITKACAFNLAQGPAPSDCASGALASATYAYTAGTPVYNPASPVTFFTYRLASATGPDNATSNFTYDGGTGAMGLVRPGETGPWQTLSIGGRPDEQYVEQPVVSRQDFADGGYYAYSWAEGPATNSNPTPTIAGGNYVDALGHGVSMAYGFPLADVPGNPGSSCYPQICPLDMPDDFMNWAYQQTPGPETIVDPLGRTTRFNYCDPIPMQQVNRCVVVPAVSFTDPEGAVTELEYDERRNISRVTRRPRTGSTLAPLVTSAVFDTAHIRSQDKPLSMTDARGNTTTFTYAPEHGGLLTETRPAVNGISPQTRHVYALRQARYYQGGTLTAGTGVYLRISTSACRTSAATGSPASPCATAGDEVRTDYDYGPETGPNTLLLRGQAVTATDGGAATTLRTCYAYDALGRKISETGPGGAGGSCPADPPSAALPDTVSTRYDAMGRVTGTISPDPDGAGGNPFIAVRNSYDPAGRLIKVETGTLSAWQSQDVAPANWGTAFTVARSAETRYDVMSRKVREWTREGASGAVRTMTEYSYDLAGRLTCTAVRMNPAAFAFTGLPDACEANDAGSDGPDRITRNVYDAAGQRLQHRVGVDSAESGENVEAADATWQYNLNGQVTTVIDGNGNRAALTYDGHGRQSCWMFPATARAQNYDDTSQTTALASAGGLGGVIEDGVCISGDYEAYAYDANGNRTALRKRDNAPHTYGVIAYEYDALNRMTRKVVPERVAPHPYPLTAAQTRDVYYGYDLRNLQLFARFDSATGEGVANQYDGFGRLLSSSTNMGGTARTLTYAYDADGNRTRITHPDGQHFDYRYDGLNRFIGIKENGDSDIVGQYYHPTGERYVLGRHGTGIGWLYDPLGQLSYQAADLPGGAVTTWNFLRNPASQITSATRSNDLYAWTGHYAVNRSYAANGLNQYTGTVAAQGGASFGYDANGNLTSDGSRTFTYDVENRLVAASGDFTMSYDPLGRLFQAGGTSDVIRYLYDADDLIAEYNPSGTMLRRYVHGAGVDDPLLWYETNGVSTNTRRQLIADERGSIVAVTDWIGNPLFINRYDEYGIPAATNAGRFAYTGQIWLPALGMYHYKARVYSPTLGRFLQVDPVGYDDQFNLYEYVGDDPVNQTDPSGETGVGALVAAGGGGALMESLAAALAPAAPVVLVAAAHYYVARTFADPGEQTLAGNSVSIRRETRNPAASTSRNPPVPGTGRGAGRPQHGVVRPGQSGPPRVVRPTHEPKKSDAPQEAARGGRYGGVIGSSGDRGRMGGRQHPGHRGGPPHGHPQKEVGRGHLWERPRQ